MEEKELIKRLRNYFDLPEEIVSDEELLSVTKDTLGKAKIEIRMNIKSLLKEIIPKWLQNMTK